ncbi:FadR/GntR family transcriptional regulator [Bosea sp. (in: a-proteobacteria)]
MLIEKERRPVAMELVRQIQRLMAEQGLKPGDKVPPQRELAATFGASRPTVREAVLQLEAMGLIRVEPARGAYVTEAFGRPAVNVSEWSFAERFSQVEIYQLRFALESFTIRLAARNISNDDLQRLTALNEAMHAAIEEGRYRDAMASDFNFHLAIAEIAGNRAIRDILALYRPIITQTQRPPIAEPQRLGEAYREHGSILRALSHRDGETAAVAMRHHILQSTDRMDVAFVAG